MFVCQRPGSASAADFESWKAERAASGFPRKPGDDVLRIYTTRPDTLFGATYMVIAPEHPFVDRLTAVLMGVLLSGLAHGIFWPVTAGGQFERTLRGLI